MPTPMRTRRWESLLIWCVQIWEETYGNIGSYIYATELVCFKVKIPTTCTRPLMLWTSYPGESSMSHWWMWAGLSLIKCLTSSKHDIFESFKTWHLKYCCATEGYSSPGPCSWSWSCCSGSNSWPESWSCVSLGLPSQTVCNNYLCATKYDNPWAMLPASLLKVPNNLKIVSQRPSRREMDLYRNADRLGALHRAAAKLWAKGVPMKEAMKIVSTAVTESASS